jgi:hypothetical protein
VPATQVAHRAGPDARFPPKVYVDCIDRLAGAANQCITYAVDTDAPTQTTPWERINPQLNGILLLQGEKRL